VAFALGDAQIDIADDGDIAKTLFNPTQFDRGAHAAIPFSRAVLVAWSGVPDPGPGLSRNQESTDQENDRHRPYIRARRIEVDAERLDVGIVTGLTVKCTMVSIDRMRLAIIASVAPKAIR